MSKIIRCLGNTTVNSSKDGAMTIYLSMCNNTSHMGSVTSKSHYDSAGALRFTVTVVMVYGIAVVGVFALGLLKRKKRNKENDDKEAMMFIKDYDNVRRTFEQKSRVGAVSSLLHHIHQPVENQVVKRENLLTNLAFLALPLSKITEEKEPDNDDQEDAESNLPSSVVIEEEHAQLCIFCNNPIGKENQVGPLCDNCVNKYKNSEENYEVDFYSYGQSIESDGFICSSDTEDASLLFEENMISKNGEEFCDVQNEIEALYNEDDGPMSQRRERAPMIGQIRQSTVLQK